MIHRIVKLTFKSENIDTFKEIFDTSKAKIAGFDGCHEVNLLQDKNSPNVFFTYSLWDDETALNNYRHSPLFKDTWAKTKVLFDGKPEAWSTHHINHSKAE